MLASKVSTAYSVSLVVICGLVFSSCHPFVLEPGKSVVLPEDQAPLTQELCSRPGPPPFDATWTPSPEDVAALEANLGKLRRLRANQCCFLGAKVEDPNRYGRQYLGLIDGRRMIYIVGIYEFSKPSPTLWDYCDGGDSIFGVLYDPETERFSDLAFNGFA